ncbi:hypothetical protein [Adhaeretor mobilis]|uniref:Uncharacterized protein n=1 Tax=Adhaeretor mobilis TaxID=1930276 RepID=A0A517MXM0_9BACT|nr:hypothetical protein [Adhaeretor mobilis]QDS99613.1 hypothetical protein HG15A2_29390 [Adhaeretor mobilis]
MNPVVRDIERRRLRLEHLEQRLVLSTVMEVPGFEISGGDNFLQSPSALIALTGEGVSLSEGGSIYFSFGAASTSQTAGLGTIGNVFDGDSDAVLSGDGIDEFIVDRAVSDGVGFSPSLNHGEDLGLSSGLVPFPTQLPVGEGGEIVVTKPVQPPGVSPIEEYPTEEAQSEHESAASRVAEVTRPALENVRVRASWFEVAAAEKQGSHAKPDRAAWSEDSVASSQHGDQQPSDQQESQPTSTRISKNAAGRDDQTRLVFRSVSFKTADAEPNNLQLETNSHPISPTDEFPSQSRDSVTRSSDETTRDSAISAVFTELGTKGIIASEAGKNARQDSQSAWITHDTSHIVGMALVALLSVDHLQRRQGRQESDSGVEGFSKRRKTRGSVSR